MPGYAPFLAIFLLAIAWWVALRPTKKKNPLSPSKEASQAVAAFLSRGRFRVLGYPEWEVETDLFIRSHEHGYIVFHDGSFVDVREGRAEVRSLEGEHISLFNTATGAVISSSGGSATAQGSLGATVVSGSGNVVIRRG